MPEIVFLSGPLAGQTLKLGDKPLVLGRNAESDIVLDDGAVSQQHAQLVPKGGQWQIVDLGSANGTDVNGGDVSSHWLAPGDTVTIGQSQFVMGQDEPPAPAPASQQVSAASQEDLQLVNRMRERTDRIRQETGKVIVGQLDVLDQVLMCIIAGGHALLIGLPGMAKTLMVRTIATVLNLQFKRVQFTPDLMPTDIIGTDVLETDQSTGEKVFRFIRGPIFCNLLLADEINRTPPKTQAALLEAMQEKEVTAGNETYKLDPPFFVLATQNPIEQEGTYPLPEAQLDRFMFNIVVDYPTAEEEEAIIKQVAGTYRAELRRFLGPEEIKRLQDVVRRVPAADHVVAYAAALARATRPKSKEAPDYVKEMVAWGAGPRAGIALILGAKARAVLYGRYHATTADVQAVAFPVLRHRVITTFNAEAAGVSSDDIILRLIKELQPAKGKLGI